MCNLLQIKSKLYITENLSITESFYKKFNDIDNLLKLFLNWIPMESKHLLFIWLTYQKLFKNLIFFVRVIDNFNFSKQNVLIT